jgi:hypothetical protein
VVKQSAVLLSFAVICNVSHAIAQSLVPEVDHFADSVGYTGASVIRIPTARGGHVFHAHRSTYNYGSSGRRLNFCLLAGHLSIMVRRRRS